MKKLLIIIFASLILLGCAASSDITKYRYSDGSGNSYNIVSDADGKTIEYQPVKPEFSSSGIYDGGEYDKREITDSQYYDVTSSIEKAAANTEAHIESRIMTSGLIVIEKDGNKATYILAPNSDEKIGIEEVLRDTMD